LRLVCLSTEVKNMAKVFKFFEIEVNGAGSLF
jgi:hypothetical protein